MTAKREKLLIIPRTREGQWRSKQRINSRPGQSRAVMAAGTNSKRPVTNQPGVRTCAGAGGAHGAGAEGKGARCSATGSEYGGDWLGSG
ncbi:hypothetical protein RHMOL_Rhmol04G0191900 [Rhododendron molle]|uniref:Uncharacterized protein n=1 Tax=Rhododendron molle TaxID=49168 RepID=A0ACC0P4L1_RHOML|nr:hypothetical protein RHMOL_Rhmol04G0191900 [Rhododendron molle]